MIYISKPPSFSAEGGGSGAFVWNFHRYAEKHGIKLTRNIMKARKAIIIAQHGNPVLIRMAKFFGCKIIHRLDEVYELDPERDNSGKLKKIKRLNKLADVTVFQSEFCRVNMMSVIKPTSKVSVILNGTDLDYFKPSPYNSQIYFGHVTNSVGRKKRLDVLADFIIKRTETQNKKARI